MIEANLAKTAAQHFYLLVAAQQTLHKCHGLAASVRSCPRALLVPTCSVQQLDVALAKAPMSCSAGVGLHAAISTHACMLLLILM